MSKTLHEEFLFRGSAIFALSSFVVRSALSFPVKMLQYAALAYVGYDMWRLWQLPDRAVAGLALGASKSSEDVPLPTESSSSSSTGATQPPPADSGTSPVGGDTPPATPPHDLPLAGADAPAPALPVEAL